MIRRAVAAIAGVLVAAVATAAMAFGIGGSGGVLTGGGDEIRAASHGGLHLDVAGPVFTEAGLAPGHVVERCVTLTNEDAHPADVALFGPRAEDALAPHLRLQITRGTRPAAAAGSCAGFTPVSADFGLGAPGVQFDGTLDTFPQSESAALRPEDPIQAGEARSYRLRITVADAGNAIGNLQAVQSFVFGVTTTGDGTTRTPIDPGTSRKRPPRQNPNEPTAGASDRWCARVDVPPPSKRGMRRIPNTDRWVMARRVLTAHAANGAAKKLGMRIWTNQEGRRLVFALGERWSLGVAPPRTWRTVAYQLNGEAAGSGSSRPFVWQVDPERIYPGENRVRVTVTPRTGQPVRAEFRFRMKAWGANPDESVCTLA